MAKKEKKPKAKIVLADMYDANGDWVDEKTAILGAIRRLFRQSPQFKEVIEESRIEIPKYNKDGGLSKKPSVKRTCQVCGELFSSGNIAVDHIEPMVGLHLTTKDMTYAEIIRSVICKKTNLQRICNPKKGKKPDFLQFCHQKKTHKENFIRKRWQVEFEKRDITTREGKEEIARLEGHFLEKQWLLEYDLELAEKLEELKRKEERKRLKLAKKK